MGMENLLNYIIGFFQNAANTVDRVSSGNLGAVVEESWFRVLLFWTNLIWWFIVITSVFVALWFFYLRYNQHVLVKKLKGRAVIDAYMDKARKHKDSRGKTKITLLKTRKTAPIPSYLYTQKMGKKDFYEMYLCDDGTLKPKCDVDIGIIENAIKVDDKISLQELAGWRLEEMKLAEEKYKKMGFFDKYKDQLMVFLGMIIAVAIVWITISKIQGSILTMAGEVTELSKAIIALKQSCL